MRRRDFLGFRKFHLGGHIQILARELQPALPKSVPPLFADHDQLDLRMTFIKEHIQMATAWSRLSVDLSSRRRDLI